MAGSMRARGFTLAMAGAVAVLLALPASSAATSDQRLQGDLTVTGSEGRDDLSVKLVNRNGLIEIVPAATLRNAAGETCVNTTDPFTGRAVSTTCGMSVTQPFTLTIDLRGGNDAVQAIYDPTSSGAFIGEMVASGGAGNDTIGIESPGIDATLLGGDGDDVLSASGRKDQGRSDRGIAWNGGLGADTANFAGATAANADSVVVPTHVNASLIANTVAYSVIRTNTTTGVRELRTIKTEPLDGIENLTSGSVGDILTGDKGPNVLAGGAGPDNLFGIEGADDLTGEGGLDLLDGGVGADTLDGGVGVDSFAKGDGFETYLMRDGFLEKITCAESDVVVADLADIISGQSNCASLSIAQAKHRFDTTVAGKALRRSDGAIKVRLFCPRRKTEACQGRLRASSGRGSLGSKRYRIAVGGFRTLRVGAAPRGAKVKLKLTEVDADGLPRKVIETRRVKRRRSN